MTVNIDQKSIGHSNSHVGDFKPSFNLVKTKCIIDILQVT